MDGWGYTSNTAEALPADGFRWTVEAGNLVRGSLCRRLFERCFRGDPITWFRDRLVSYVVRDQIAGALGLLCWFYRGVGILGIRASLCGKKSISRLVPRRRKHSVYPAGK